MDERIQAGGLDGRRQSQRDTVGAVAIDAAGNLAVGNSTGGTSYKWPGRVGDTPIIGCGLYAETLGAAACTGWGEQIMKTVLAKRTVDQIDWLGSATDAPTSPSPISAIVSAAGRRDLRFARRGDGLRPQHALHGPRLPDPRHGRGRDREFWRRGRLWKKRVRVVISGRVQGVGFRVNCQREDPPGPDRLGA